MRLAARAFDYDGTIAQGDQIDLSVREAIAYARDAGVIILLVTGRSLLELQLINVIHSRYDLTEDDVSLPAVAA